MERVQERIERGQIRVSASFYFPHNLVDNHPTHTREGSKEVSFSKHFKISHTYRLRVLRHAKDGQILVDTILNGEQCPF